MVDFYRIAKKDINTLLENFSNYASKACGRYKRIRYEKWKRLKDVDSWEIRFSDYGLFENPLYSTLINGITVRAIKGDPADNSSETELFEFQAEDGSFGSFLEYERNEGVLTLMSSMFDENIFAAVDCTAIDYNYGNSISSVISGTTIDYGKVDTISSNYYTATTPYNNAIT